MNQTEIFGVSQYLDRLNILLKKERAKILGEISGLQEYPERSYLYFSIKDKKGEGTIKCFMWKRDFVLSGVTLKEGLEVVVTAFPNIYKPNGGMTLQIESVELLGEGALKIAYEELKKKLTLEGLLSPERKREIPAYPQKIGVITSKSGAVINDFLSNIGKFGYEIFFVDSKVEGQDAIKDLLLAIKTLEKKDLDVLVLMRGGGSLESFQAFNNEVLVRAVANFPVPVLTGIGHDKDAPLVSLVSDKNVSTPTATANLLNSSWTEALLKIKYSEQKIFSEFEKLISFLGKSDEILLRILGRMEMVINRLGERVSDFGKNIERGFSQLFLDTQRFVAESNKSIDLSSPERALSQGYSIVKHKGKVLKSSKNLH